MAKVQNRSKAGRAGKPETSDKTGKNEVRRRRIPALLAFNVAVVAVFAVLSTVLLANACGVYLQRVESLSFFIGTSSMFDKCMATPGGLIHWLSLYLTQFFHHPWIGASIYTALLIAVWLAFAWAVGLPRRWFAAAVVLPSALLLVFTNLGYLIFTLKPVGFAYALPLGLLISLLLYRAYRVLRWWLWRALAVAVIIVAGYPLMGFYALLCGALCAVDALIASLRDRRFTALVPLLTAVAVGAWVPWTYFMYVGGDLIYSQRYVVQLPRFYAGETGYRLAYAAIFAVCLAAAAVRGLWRGPRTSSPDHRLSVTAAVVAVAALVATPLLRYSDANFYLTLRLDKALWQQDYRKAVDEMQLFDQTPTRLNSVLAHVALLRTGEAADRLFSVGYGWQPCGSSRGARALHDAEAPLISYHLGLVNYCYRWCTENLIGQGLSAERLKLMTKCALINYEPDLAKTYLDLLYNTPLHREWARKYKRYLADPMLIASDPEIQAVKQLMCLPNEFINDKGEYEGYVWPLLAAAPLGTRSFDELSMEAALLTRDLDTFIAKLAIYAKNSPRIPRHFQEAALLWAMLSKQPCPVGIDPAIEANHKEFVKAFRNTSLDTAEVQREEMRPRFDDTYWFYYVFYDNMDFH